MLRWLAVARPLRHRTITTPTRMLLVCVGIWLFVGLSSAPFLSNGVTNRAGFPRCFEPSSPSSWGRVLILNYLALALGFLLPFLTIIFCYSRIVRRLTSSTGAHGSSLSSNARQRNRRRSVHLVSMVTMTFLFCFLPYHVIRSLHLHAVCGRWDCSVTVALQRAVVVTLCLAASNSVVNPLLYYYSTRTFRDNMRDAQFSLLTSRGSSFRFGLALMRRRDTTREGDSVDQSSYLVRRLSGAPAVTLEAVAGLGGTTCGSSCGMPAHWLRPPSRGRARTHTHSPPRGQATGQPLCPHFSFLFLLKLHFPSENPVSSRFSVNFPQTAAVAAASGPDSHRITEFAVIHRPRAATSPHFLHSLTVLSDGSVYRTVTSAP
ncbi:hypothetical protein PAMP_016097 [Pampus punctatissimus]